MLTAIREGSKGWISGVIIGAIVLTFALFGISSYLEGGEEVPVAVVNGEEIDNYLYQNQLAQQRQAMLSRFGGNFDPSLLDSLGIRDQVVNGLIEGRLIDQYASSQNYRLSDRQLSTLIQTNEQFQTDGRFDTELYQRVIASNGMTPQGFEALERRNGLTRQLQQAITESAFTVEDEFSRLLSLQDQTRDVQYVLIPGDRFSDQFAVEDAEVKTYYEENIENYQTPERMRVEYIDLNLADIAAEITPTENDIQQTYDRLKGQLTEPEVRKASHILFTVDSDADDAAKQAVREKAEAIFAEVNNGGDFAALAEQHSEDPGSARNGGDLGIVARGQIVQPFEDAVYSLTEGEVVGPVETQFGFHLIQLTELVEQRQKTLDESREDIVKDAARGLAEAAFADLVEPLESLVFEQSDSLIAAADETGLPIQTSDWFSLQEGDGIATEFPVRQAAFEPDVRDDELNSPLIELGFERMVALRKVDHEAASARPLEDVQEEIVTQIKADRSKQKLASEASGFLEGLSHQASWDIMLAKNELQAETLAAKRRDISPTLSEMADVVYRIKPEDAGQPVYGHVIQANGDVVLYALNGVTLGSTEAADEQVRQQLTQQLAARDGVGVFRQFVNVIKEKADIVINEEQL